MKTLISPRPSVSVFPLLDLAHLLKKPLPGCSPALHPRTIRPPSGLSPSLWVNWNSAQAGRGDQGRAGTQPHSFLAQDPAVPSRPSCPWPHPGGGVGAPAQPAGCRPAPTHGGLRAGAVRMPTSLCCRIPVASPDPLPPCGDSSISFRAKETF